MRSLGSGFLSLLEEGGRGMSLLHRYRCGLGLCLLPFLLQVNGAQDSERILLRDVQALTLYSGYTSHGAYPRSRSSGPGFWTGLGTGGLLGYLLSSRRSQPNPSPYVHYPNYSAHQPQTSGQTGWNPESRETRTTSGFGGTKRR
ncbi:store-operated calcium entry-associated regulatory factor isoform X2 [Chiloscyllium plagiosum]|uniref:store-operated calcium entry-associated regulatory factor isoform X2 n=1 Tax=Chiloscyllium plagiosum TaxID=36176 RepID=UPI001CB7ADF1|nr:store-operated calcium entry-associated regulatory factor isoform X2 [Chiloscyllium plagiosum]